MTFALTVTRGTIGRVISFEEYCEYRHWNKDGTGFPEHAKEDFNEGSMCPVRIEWFAPLEPGDQPRYHEIVAVSSEILELIETNPHEAQTTST